MRKAKGSSYGRTRASYRESAKMAARARGALTKRRGDLGEMTFVQKAMRLGFVVAKPYGEDHRYDFMVEGGHKIWRVQVKTSASVRKGLWGVNIRRRTNSIWMPYTESELDFLAAYILPEDTWYILPVREIIGRTGLLFRSKGSPTPDIYAHYREAWHLLGEPPGPPI